MQDRAFLVRLCPRDRNEIGKRIAGVETSVGVEHAMLRSGLRGADSAVAGPSGGEVDAFRTGMLAMAR
jgi:hypothetical protein